MTDVYVSGTHGYDTFRIPAIVATRAGTLLAFAEGRRNGAGDSGDIDLVLRRSFDQGHTWEPLRIVSAGNGDTVGNPCPIVDPASGDVVLLTTRNAGDATEHALLRGQVSAADSRRVWVQRSVDNGSTWSTPVDVTTTAKRPEWCWYATGPGHGIALRGGRLLAPANHSVGDVYGGHVLLSDDGGHTWRIGGVEAGNGRVNPNETTAAELPDGTVYLNTRNQLGTAPGTRAQTVSSNGGEGFDKPYEPVPSIVGPVVQGSVLTVGSRLVLALPSDPDARRAMAIRSSEDGGLTWSPAAVVSQDPAAYSDLVALTDGSIGLLYETGEAGPYERIRYLREGD